MPGGFVSTEFVPPSGGIKGTVEQDPGSENLHFGNFGIPGPPQPGREPLHVDFRVPLGCHWGVCHWHPLMTLGRLWEPFGPPRGPTPAFLESRGHHFAAPGRHPRHHAARTCVLPVPGREKEGFLGVLMLRIYSK